MVSYYNTLPYSQKHNPANLAYSSAATQPWQWAPNYHPAPNHQFLTDMESPQVHPSMYYNPHHMFHPAAGGTSEWHSPTPAASDNYSPNAPNSHHLLHHLHVNNTVGSNIGNSVGGGSSSSSSSSGSASVGPALGNAQLNENVSTLNEQQIDGLPSPPITVSGSEISSPGAQVSSSPHHIAQQINNSPTPSTVIGNSVNRSPIKTQYYDWMKRPTYPTQPTPGKTRTKDKYRVVYTDYQRLELEKEYCTSRYITIRRKTELAQTLSLSERQVKIWFQNRRAKERKQNKKGNDSLPIGGIPHSEYSNLRDPKAEPGLHIQHSLHSINPMTAMSMSTIRLHPHIHSHHALSVHPHTQLHQPQHVAPSSSISSM